MSALIPKIVADFTTQLSTAISIGGTTFSLASILDDDGNTIPNGKYCFTIDNGSSDKEYLMGDMVSGVVSNVVTVNRQGTEASGAVRAHRIGASVILTDFVALQRIADILRGILTLDGSSPLAYDTSPTLSSGLQVATVAYVLSVVTGGTVNFDNQIISGTAGETLALPNVVYFKESDQRWWLADSDVSSTFYGTKKGIARGSASAGNAASIQLSGIASGFTSRTPGAKQYLSGTAGGVTETAPTNAVFIGWAITSTTILLAFNERGALLGTQGFPGENNPFVTADNVSQNTTDQTQSSQNATIEVGEADSTTKKNKVAQSFIPTKTKIRGVKLYKGANTGTPTGTLVVALQADSSGSPSGSDLATVTISNIDVLSMTTGEFDALFSSEYTSLVPGSLYWIVISSSVSDTSNHVNLGTASAGGYGNGSVKYNNTTDGWVAVSTIDLYFKTLEGNVSQIPKIGSDGFLKGVFKKPTYNLYDTASSTLGDSTTQFDVTNPSGQIYRYTYDSTGTDPLISSSTMPIGSIVDTTGADNFASGNRGVFVVVGVGTNYFEVSNASGVVESNKTIGSNGSIAYSGTNFYTHGDNISYLEIDLQGGGAGGRSSTGDTHNSGGNAGSWCKKFVQISGVNQRIPYLVGIGAAAEKHGTASAVYVNGTLIYAPGGLTPATDEATIAQTNAVNGDINIPGGQGKKGNGNTSTDQVGGDGGDSQLGRGGAGGEASNGEDGTGYGSGGGGAANTGGGGVTGGSGRKGCVIIREI